MVAAGVGVAVVVVDVVGGARVMPNQYTYGPRRARVITLRISEEEYRLLRRAARAARRTVSDYLRHAAAMLGVTPPPAASGDRRPDP